MASKIQGSNAYKEAGVDTEKAAALVDKIKPLAKKTDRPGVVSGLGGFGALFDLKETGYKDPLFVSGTDGVGTKLKIAIHMDKHDTIGIDAVAMCVNDIVVQGAEPLFFLDYFATGQLSIDVAEMVISGISEGCQQAGCALIGGETAEMPGMYSGQDYDIAGFSVGAVEREHLISGKNIKEGDLILGLASNGLHSNGFSLVRRLIENTDGFSLFNPAPFAPEIALGEMLLIPTRIYVKSILDLLRHFGDNRSDVVKGMAHITGGGFTENVPRIIPEGLRAEIDCEAWELPPLFSWLQRIGNLKAEDMGSTLNCGIGMVIVCDRDYEQECKEHLINNGETVYELGEVTTAGNPDERIVLHNLESAWAL